MPIEKHIPVRDFRPSDVEAFVEIFRSAVRLVARRDYTEEQTIAWAPDEIDTSGWEAHYAGRQTFVAEIDGRPVGFTDLEPDGHLNMLYVHASYQRQGVASALLRALEGAASRQGMRRVYTEASITARRFFERCGFRVIAPQVVSTRGQEFINYTMEKNLRGADELEIRDYDPTWPDRFTKLAATVNTGLGALALRIEHVGSTAVPGLAAKPVIDIDVVLAAAADLPEVIRRLERLGYVHEGELGIAGREAFRWPLGEARHHLYVMIEGAAELRRHLRFRDALRADRAVRDAYGALKQALAARHSHDRAAYTEAKSAFIAGIVGN
jgi:putative acetyltransferase